MVTRHEDLIARRQNQLQVAAGGNGMAHASEREASRTKDPRQHERVIAYDEMRTKEQPTCETAHGGKGDGHSRTPERIAL